MWQPLLMYSVMIALLIALFSYKLGTMPMHISNDELHAVEAAGDWHHLLANPLYAPHKVILFAFRVASVDRLVALRSASVFWALLIVLLFFSTLRHWFSKRIAVMGSLLLASSSWFLWAARSLTPEIMQASLIALLALGGWLRYSRARVGPLLAGVLLTAAVCYIPGMIWFVLLAVIWQRRAIKSSLEETPGLLTAFAVFLYVLLIAPLLYAIVRNPHLLQNLLGLPTQWSAWQQIVRNALNIPLALFMRAPLNPAHWVGQLPLLDLFSIVMFVLGLYNFFFLRKLDRAKILIGLLVLVSALITLGGGITLIMLLPAIYIIVACGIDFLLQQWFKIFPRNPLARGMGLTLIVLSVLIAGSYQTARYYKAWLGAPTTKAIYSQTL